MQCDIIIYKIVNTKDTKYLFIKCKKSFNSKNKQQGVEKYLCTNYPHDLRE